MSHTKLSVWDELPTGVLLAIVFGLFLLLQYKIFLFGHWRWHGDYTHLHFVSAYFLDALSLDLEVPVWQPYRNLGSLNIWGLIMYNPLLTLLAFLIYKIGTPLGLPSHSLFQVTWLAYMLTYGLSFGMGCYLLARDNLQTKSSHVMCFAMALLGTQIYILVYAMGYLLFFVPYFLIFFVRFFRQDGKESGLDLLGLVVTAYLLMVSNIAINHVINFFLLLFLALRISGFKFRYYFELVKTLVNRAMSWRRLNIGVLCGLLVLVVLLSSLKLVLLTRMDELTFPRRHVQISTGLDFITKNFQFINSTALSLYSNNFKTILENLINWSSYDKSLQAYEFPRLYFGLLPVFVFFLMWPRTKDRMWITLLLTVAGTYLMSTNARDNFNIVLPIMAIVNPLLSFGTRHVNFALILASPIMILLLGMALDKFILARETDSNVFIGVKRLILVVCVLCGLASIVNRNRYLAYTSVILAFCFLFTYMPKAMFKRAKVPLGYAILMVMLIELAIPFYNFTSTFFCPFGQEQAASTFGENLPGPRLQGFPVPFCHTFSYWFDAKGLVTTKNEYYELHNAAFKFFSGFTWDQVETKGFTWEQMQFLRRHNERLFWVDSVVIADGQRELFDLTKHIYDSDLNDSVAAVDPTSDLPRPNSPMLIRGNQAYVSCRASKNNTTDELEDIPINSQKISGANFRYLRSCQSNPGLKIFEIALPDNFPRYLTTNPYDMDVEDITLNGSDGEKFKPTYFDIFSDTRNFQINFTRYGKLEISIANERPPDVLLTWKDRFAVHGIEILRFSYNSLMMRTNIDRERFLVYMDRFDKRWKCYIDGNEVPIYKTNIEFKGILVPEGQHEIYFIYADPVLKTAWVMYTLGYLAACTMVIGLTIRTQQNRT